MAPEQFQGDWRSYGPWTDLYALGCVAWHCVTGEGLYRGKDAYFLRGQHLAGVIPKLEPRFEIPKGLEDWIHRAIAVKVDARFQRAADALAQLPLGEDVEFAEVESEESLVESVTMEWGGHTLNDHHRTTLRLTQEASAARFVKARAK